mmetsp:Transcript_22883/g.49855  ORF Transcript_22883/g.49855 Transcript_22883/m.49855 type:complete len:202 (+) Transcript_22883:2469-3074(+)
MGGLKFGLQVIIATVKIITNVAIVAVLDSRDIMVVHCFLLLWLVPLFFFFFFLVLFVHTRRGSYYCRFWFLDPAGAGLVVYLRDPFGRNTNGFVVVVLSKGGRITGGRRLLRKRREQTTVVFIVGTNHRLTLIATVIVIVRKTETIGFSFGFATIANVLFLFLVVVRREGRHQKISVFAAVGVRPTDGTQCATASSGPHRS